MLLEIACLTALCSLQVESEGFPDSVDISLVKPTEIGFWRENSSKELLKRTISQMPATAASLIVSSLMRGLVSGLHILRRLLPH